MHRDISIANIYSYNGRGILADFEYAKKMGTEIDCEMNVVSTVELTQSRRSLLNITSGKLHKPDKPSQDLSTPHKAMQEAGCLHRGYKRKHLLARGHQSSYGV